MRTLVRNAVLRDPQRWASTVALFAPAAMLLAFVALSARSFPIWETWVFIPVWADFRNGGPWLADLFISRWGHISAIPNFVNLLLDTAFNYDQRVDIWASALAAIASLYLLLKFYLPRSAPLTRIFLGLTFLSLRAAEIWLDGWDTVMTISLLFALAAGACVLHSRSWKALLACAALTFLGINSGGYCLPVIPAILAILLLRACATPPVQRRRALAQILSWLGWSFALWIYWTHLRRGHAGPLLHTLSSGDFYSLFARLMVLTMSQLQPLGALMAIVTALMFVIALTMRLRDRRNDGHLPALIYLVVYAGVLSILIGTGRTLGGALPLHARYIPFLCLLPVALLTFAEVSAARVQPHETLAPLKTVVRAGLCAFIAVAVYNDWLYYLRDSAPNAPQLAALDHAWRESPYTVTPGMFMLRAQIYPDLVAQGLQTMQRLHIGPFRGKRPPEWNWKTQPQPPGNLAESFTMQHGVDQTVKSDFGTLLVNGWAFDPMSGKSPQAVYAVSDRGCVETALQGLPRPDVADHFHSGQAENSGWLITFPAGCSAETHGQAVFYFLTVDGRWNSVAHAM